MKLRETQLRKLIIEAIDDISEEEFEPEEEYEPLGSSAEAHLGELLKAGDIAQVEALASAVAGPEAFSKLVRTTLARNEVLENKLTDEILHHIENMVMDIYEKGLNSMGITLNDHEDLTSMEDTGITEDEQNDIYMELVFGVKQNIINAIENAIVQTANSIAGVN